MNEPATPIPAKPSRIWLYVIATNLVIILLTGIGIVAILIKPETKESDPEPITTNTVVPSGETTYKPDVNYTFTLDNFPKIDGSTSNVPLRSFIICKLLNYSCQWQEYSDSIDTKERYVDIKTSDENLTVIRSKSVNSTTHNAYVKLINGETDLILVATEPSADETKLLTEKNVTLDIQPVAIDAFVYLVNKENPVDNLTIQQVLDIYTGKTTNWNELNGLAQKINAYQREDNSGSQELMKKLVLKGVTPINAPELTISGMSGLINRVSNDKQGIGYSVYYYEQFMVPNAKLKLLAIEGVKPSTETLTNQSYPLTAPVFIVTRKDLQSGTAAANLRDWLMTKAGQDTVTESGYVPVVNQ
ncbi:MAG: substrate-binding domain-containing protein [bacterium]